MLLDPRSQQSRRPHSRAHGIRSLSLPPPHASLVRQEQRSSLWRVRKWCVALFVWQLIDLAVHTAFDFVKAPHAVANAVMLCYR